MFREEYLSFQALSFRKQGRVPVFVEARLSYSNYVYTYKLVDN